MRAHLKPSQRGRSFAHHSMQTTNQKQGWGVHPPPFSEIAPCGGRPPAPRHPGRHGVDQVGVSEPRRVSQGSRPGRCSVANSSPPPLLRVCRHHVCFRACSSPKPQGCTQMKPIRQESAWQTTSDGRFWESLPIFSKVFSPAVLERTVTTGACPRICPCSARERVRLLATCQIRKLESPTCQVTVPRGPGLRPTIESTQTTHPFSKKKFQRCRLGLPESH